MLKKRFLEIKAQFKERFLSYLPAYDFSGLYFASVIFTVVGVMLAFSVYDIYVSMEPPLFDILENQKKALADDQKNTTEVPPPGYLLSATLTGIADVLLHKPGGYLRNDILPPTVWLDNMPNWEMGVLTQIRDLTRVMRRSMARSQSQSLEDPKLAAAEPYFNIDADRWLLPAAENEYQKGLTALIHYRRGLLEGTAKHSAFYPRADNLADWLGEVSKRLGGLSQRLSASVGQKQIPGALHHSVDNIAVDTIQTSWFRVDDIFYEARGATWALVELFKAVEVDFHDVLAKKNAIESVQQIIRDLEMTQGSVWSPMILNGSNFGLLANHSLNMLAFISQANAAIIDLRDLLAQG